MEHCFETRAAALRSLKDISTEACKHAKEILFERNGKYCFDEDFAENFRTTPDYNEITPETIMNRIDIKNATTTELVEFYNDHAESSIKKFRDRATAESRCQAILDAIAAEAPAEEPEDDRTDEDRKAVFDLFAQSSSSAPAAKVALVTNQVIEDVKAARAPSVTQPYTMKTSLKLDRKLVALDEEKVYDNAHRMWKAHPDWMTSSQQDTLTAKLYTAAKKGEKIVVTINGRKFTLVSMR